MRFWERQLLEALAEVRAELALVADEIIPDQVLVAETVALGDPATYEALEAVIPAGNTELAATWMRARLKGEADSDELRAQLARKLAPAPDHEPTGTRKLGLDRRGLERAIVYERDRPKRP